MWKADFFRQLFISFRHQRYFRFEMAKNSGKTPERLRWILKRNATYCWDEMYRKIEATFEILDKCNFWKKLFKLTSFQGNKILKKKPKILQKFEMSQIDFPKELWIFHETIWSMIVSVINVYIVVGKNQKTEISELKVKLQPWLLPKHSGRDSVLTSRNFCSSWSFFPSLPY